MTRILITRSRTQADDFAEKLRSAGFEPILFPVIEICPIENNNALKTALENIQNYDWVVFTSANAVPPTISPHFRRIWGERKRNVKIAAIGPKTVESLRRHGLDPDFVPGEYIAEAILSGLGDVRNKWILLPRAEIARKALPEAISKAGGIAHEIAVYRTLPAQINMVGLNALRSGVDVIAFTSASTVENFVAICEQNGLDPLLLPNRPLSACIGPVTAQAAKEAGFQNIVIAEEYTTEGLLEVIGRWVNP